MNRKRPSTGSGKALAPIFTKKATPLMPHPNKSQQSRENSQSYPNQKLPSRGRPVSSYQQQIPQHQGFPPNHSFASSNAPAPQSTGQRPPPGHQATDAWRPRPSQPNRVSQGSYMPPGGAPGPGGDYFSPHYPREPYQSQEGAYNYQSPRGNYQGYQPQAPYPAPPPVYQEQYPPPQYREGGQYHPYGGGGEGYFPQYRPAPPEPQPHWEAPAAQGKDTKAEQNMKDDIPAVNKEYEMRKKPQPDCSLRFLTASVQGTKHWARYVDKLPIMFELFGVLNSQVTTGNDGYSCSKEFLLKDDKDSLRCVFYQIDRMLPKMVRGRWYRCVGHLQQGRLNCVAVREATDMEKKMHKTLISTCDRAMRDWTAKVKEM